MSYTGRVTWVTKDDFLRVDLGIGKWEAFVNEAAVLGNGKTTHGEFIAFFSLGDAECDPDRLFGALFGAVDENGGGILQQSEIADYQWYKNLRVFGLLGISDFTELSLRWSVERRICFLFGRQSWWDHCRDCRMEEPLLLW